MLARIASELYWVGRNIVRAEHTARMLDGLFLLELEGGAEDPASVPLSWQSIVVVMGIEDAEAAGSDITREGVIRSLSGDRDNPYSLISCVGAAREGARQLRETLPAEVWESLNTYHLTMRRRNLEHGPRTGPDSAYSYVKERSALFWGLCLATMQRDAAYSFLGAGARIEAAEMVLRMLRVAFPPVRSADDESLELPRRDGNAIALLRATGGFQAFMRSAAAAPRAEPVARFLLFESAFPDSVAGSVTQLGRLVGRIDPAGSTATLRIARLISDLGLRSRSELTPAEMPRAFREIQNEIERVESDIAARYFSPDDQGIQHAVLS